jgi:hypothetical protein
MYASKSVFVGVLILALVAETSAQKNADPGTWSKTESETIVRKSLGSEDKGLLGVSLVGLAGMTILARWITAPTAGALDRLSELDERGRVPHVEGLYDPNHYTIAFSVADLIRNERLLGAIDIPDFGAVEMFGDEEIPLVLRLRGDPERSSSLASIQVVPARSVGFIRTEPMLLRFGRVDRTGRPLVESLNQEIELAVELGDTGRTVRIRFKLKDLPVDSLDEL